MSAAERLCQSHGLCKRGGALLVAVALVGGGDLDGGALYGRARGAIPGDTAAEEDASEFATIPP